MLSESDSEEPSSMSEGEESQASAKSFATDPTAWNRMKPRAWEDPVSDEEAPSDSDGWTPVTPEPSASDFTQDSRKWIMDRDNDKPYLDWDGLFD